VSALLAVVLALFALSDLIAVSSAEEMARFYWLNQAPVRLLFFFILTGYTYTFKYTGSRGAYVGEDLKNSFVFTWGFVEMVSWFWVRPVFSPARERAGPKEY
jgi:Increased loss of mitochondrial DNA protein 1